MGQQYRDSGLVRCGILVVRQEVRERQVWSKPAIQWKIPEQISRMTVSYHGPDIQRK